MEKQKIALVTGASSGFGEMITKQLAQDGFYVFAIARRKDKLETLRCDHIEPITVDVTQSNEIDVAIQHITKNKRTIDLLVNNAGFGYYSTIEEASISEVKYQFDVNFLGIMRMTQAVLPIMRQQKSGMIINISSVVGQVSMPVSSFYAATKHAVEAFSDGLRMEVAPFGIKVIVIEPGAFKTEFHHTALNSLQKSHQLDAYDPIVTTMQQAFLKAHSRAPGPTPIAKVIHKIVNCKHPKRRYPVGIDARILIFIKKKIGDFVIDNALKFLLKKIER